MNRIKLQLTDRELTILISFIEQVLPKKPVNHLDKLLATCLAEMLHKLKLTAVMVKSKYTIQIARTWGHALVHFCTTNTFRSIGTYRIVINNVISVIDQKTA